MNFYQRGLEAISSLHGWMGAIVVALFALVCALVMHSTGAVVMRRLATRHPFVATLHRRIYRPSRAVLLLFALEFAWRLSPDDLRAIETIRRVNTIAFIGTLTWLAVACVAAVSDAVIELHITELHTTKVTDNLRARRVLTQTRVLTRSVTVMIVLVGISFALMTLPGVRQLGTSLLASAGVAGVVAGIAARPVLGNFIAGLQLAFSQPLRLDDVLIVDKEWGRVEEITGSYVVLALWDERRLIVPLQWFIEHPFQNWTRTTSTLLGSVFMFVDYRTPVTALRAELERYCRGDKDWDGRVCSLQVTDATERTMQLRLLVSSANSSSTWDLRCRVREAMIDYMRRELPDYLPTSRVELTEQSAPAPR